MKKFYAILMFTVIDFLGSDAATIYINPGNAYIAEGTYTFIYNADTKQLTTYSLSNPGFEIHYGSYNGSAWSNEQIVKMKQSAMPPMCIM